MARRQQSLGDYLDDVVLPAVFERLDEAFPEFGWRASSDGWVATNRDTTKRLFDARPERVVCNRPFGVLVHGGPSLSWPAYLCGGEPPRGRQFLEVARRLCELAGVAFPDHEVSAEELHARERAERRRAALEKFFEITARFLHEDIGAAARCYLEARGIDEAVAKELGLGFFPTVQLVRRALPAEVHDAAKEASLLWEKLEGYVLFPARDPWGRPLTVFGRWAAANPPEGRPKTISPAGGAKTSPLYFDQTRAERVQDLVVVEGLFDAAVLRARGDRRVVACLAAQLGTAQLEVLARHRVRSITLCLDADEAGSKGTLASVRALAKSGVATYVAPPLPGSLDPDELVLRDGIDAWRAHVAQAVSGARYRIDRALAAVTKQSPQVERDSAVAAVKEIVAELHGARASRDWDEALDRLAAATGYKLSTLKREIPRPEAPAAEEVPPVAAPAAREQGERPDTWPYVMDDSGTRWLIETETKEGFEIREEKLSNFPARITAELTEDDGAEERRFFEIEARICKAPHVVRVPADEFEAMSWVIPKLGPVAIVEPGPKVRDRLRHAIQVVSGMPRKRTAYAHLGWRRIADQWVYLHAGGALGAEGPVAEVEVSLAEPFDRFLLPAPPREGELVDCVFATLRILEVAPPHVTYALLAALVRAPLGACMFSLYVVGTTGGQKTSLVALIQQHWGAALRADNLPSSWESTANAIEGLLFLAKDAVFAVDDFVPSGAATDKAKKHKDADRVIRGQGNRAGRQRMRHDERLRPVRRSRALLISTGEELPRGESLNARMLVLRVEPGDVRLPLLSRCQQDGDSGVFARTFAAYIAWLAGDDEAATIRENPNSAVTALRADFKRDGLHGRTPDTAASLFLGLKTFARFVVSTGAYSQVAADAFLESARRALLDAIERQAQGQEESNPLRRFFELLATGVACGRGHVAGLDGRVPREAASAWGWRRAAEGRVERYESYESMPEQSETWEAQGERIGWIDEDDLYLELQAAMNLVERMAGEEGFALSPRALRQRLKEAKLLRSLPQSRETACVRVMAEGARRSVVHLGAEVLLGLEAGQVEEPLHAA